MKKFIQRAAVVMLAAALILSTAATAPATTWTVTSSAGYGTGTLRDAIGMAQNGDTIVFDPSLNGQTIDTWTNNPFSSPPECIEIFNKDLTIVGPGASKLAISGGGLHAFFVDAAQVTVSGLTIEGGGLFGGFDPGFDDGLGGAIINLGELTLSDCIVSGSSAEYGGGGIYNAGTMTINNCMVADNNSPDGGGIYNSGAMVLSYSTVTGNTANYGGGIFNDTTGTLLLNNCNVSGNSQRKGKDIYNLGKVTKSK